MNTRERFRAHPGLAPRTWLAVLATAGVCWSAQLGATAPLGIRISVVEGDGAINNITEGRARDPVVRVIDDDGRAMPGAAVTFLLPDLGAGGTFPTGASVTVVTGEDGMAMARGLRPNNVAGQFQIRVTASYRSLVARASITQTNAAMASASTRKSSGKWVALVAIIGGGAAAGAALALTGSSSGSPGGGSPTPVRPPTTITPGGGGFGAP